MVHRHLLAGDGESVEQVVESLIALHATDPATVYLSVLARNPHTTLAGIGAALNESRSLVRWMAMRRTLFVLPEAGCRSFRRPPAWEWPPRFAASWCGT